MNTPGTSREQCARCVGNRKRVYENLQEGGKSNYETTMQHFAEDTSSYLHISEDNTSFVSENSCVGRESTELLV